MYFGVYFGVWRGFVITSVTVCPVRNGFRHEVRLQ